MKTSKLSCLSLLVLASCGQPQVSSLEEAWNKINDPIALLDASWERSLAKLPTEGQATQMPWTDSYWPSADGGIAYRWNDAEGASESSWKYALHSQKTVLGMTTEELARLSPAEKFDIINGNFTYPTVRLERKRTSPSNPRWFGICHGWAAASMIFEEPAPVTYTSRDGIKVPFGSADVKALLSYYQGQIAQAPTKALGGRCDYNLETDPGAKKRSECRDTNAGAFHLVLTNMIGIRKQAFAADVSRGDQVWNHPIHSFKTRKIKTQKPSRNAARGTVKETVMETVVTYTVELQPSWDALLGTDVESSTSATYRYVVEQDAKGHIIGGEWLTNERPDFLWMQEKPDFNRDWKKLESIYQVSLQQKSASPDLTPVAK